MVDQAALNGESREAEKVVLIAFLIIPIDLIRKAIVKAVGIKE